jgi:4a-hydroxytetrahydrobiopterin dehydratase
MPDSLTFRQFHEADGVEDWRAVADCVGALFRTDGFAHGVRLAGDIGALVEAADYRADIDLRATSVTVCLAGGEEGGLSGRDVEVARRISATARALDAPADPAAVQVVTLTVDALDTPAVRGFWAAVLGYDERGDEDVVDPVRRGPGIWFQPTDDPRPQRNRLHVDVYVPPEQAEARIAAALAAGGRVVTDEHAPSWWVLADAEGNEACVCTWVGRE